MTCKRSLYALIAALAVGPAGADASPAAGRPPRGPAAADHGVPCGACLSVAVFASSVDAETAAQPQVAVVSPLGDWLAIDARVVAAARTIVLAIDAHAPPDATVFAARRALTELRGRNAGVQLGVSGPAAVLDGLLKDGLAAYVDVLVATDGSAALASEWRRAYRGLRLWENVTAVSLQSLLDRTVSSWGDRLLVRTPSDVTPEFLDDVGRLAELFPEGMFELPAGDVRCEPAGACVFRIYERADTLQPVVTVRRTGPGAVRLIVPAARGELFAISAAMGTAPGILDTVLALAPPIPEADRLTVWLPMTGISSFVLRLPAVDRAIAEGVRVVGERALTAEEIVARHQATAARQTRLVRTLITAAATTLTFDVPSFAAPVTIQADTTIFQGLGPTELEQRNIRVNGVPYAAGQTGTPRLPIIEPERAAAMPLTITLTRAYRYSLAGRDTVGGRQAYVVAFAPVRSGESLFAGRAWIDAETFALARVDAVQTGLRGAITASQQIDEYAPVRAGGDQVWLLARSDIRQVYQGAGLTSPIHRLVAVSRQEVNPTDFDVRRAAARASPAVMLRETPDGLRYLERRAEGGTATRTVTGRATRMGTIATGLLIDPNITRPLPYAGLGYTDFDFRKTGAQVNAFFGGAYGQFAISAPSVAGSRWQLAASGFAVLARYNDRSFRLGRERYAENIRQRPAHLVAGVLRPITARTSVRVEYLFDYTRFDPAETTSPAFVVPADQVVHGLRAALETEQAGWRLVGWWNPAWRQGWHAWGVPGSDAFEPAHRDFTRYGLSATRPWIVSSTFLARVEGVWMGSSDTDRFSRYAFGTFDNPLRGYPSAGIRYDRGAVARTALVWQPIRRLRLDAFADLAVVRDAGYAFARRAYPGIGSAVEAPGPLGLLLGAEWGYGFRGINSNGSPGTQVFRLTAYKVF